MSGERFGKDVSRVRIEQALDSAKRSAKQLIARRDELEEGMPAERLGELLELYEGLSSEVSIASQYADALFGVDTENEDLRQLASQVGRQLTELTTELLWFTLTMKDWPESSLIAYGKKLPRYEAYLERLARYAPHTLSEEEERIVAIKDLGGSDVVERIYQLVTSRFTYEIEIDGETLELTRSDLSKYFYDEKRSVRRKARDALLVPFKREEPVLAEIYAAVVQDWDAETTQLRGYESPIHARHLSSQTDPAAYEALQASVKKNVGIFRRYVELKRRALGYDEFTRYDFSAPVPGKPDEISYEESKRIVLEVFSGFASWMHAHAKTLFDEERIDVLPRKGKRGGACCYPLPPGTKPLVILNHSGLYDDMFTMAHELGHAVHDLLAADHSALTFHPSITLAETASQFAEMLLFDHELESRGPDAKVSLICHRLDDFIGSVLTQLRYVRFEERAHQLLQEGGTGSQLHGLWSELIKEDFPDIEWPDSSEYWMAIPHFYELPFYCYSYAFAMLLVLALYKRYQEVGPEFADTIRDILAAGGTREPAELLAEHGLDITSESFWDDGFAIIEGFVDQLEELLD